MGPTGPVLLDGSAPRRVCIVLLSGLGDVVHGLPLALDIKRLNPAHEVTWVAEPAPAEILRNHPAVDRIVVYRTLDGIRGLEALSAAMRRGPGRPDAEHPAVREERLADRACRGRRSRVGLPPSKTRDGVRFSSTHVLAETPWKHSQDLFLDFRWALGVPRDAPVGWEIGFSEPEIEERRAFFARLDGRPVASLVLGSANPKKDWAPERYARLADALDADFGFQVLLLGGPSAREREAADVVAARTRTRPVDGLGDSVRRLMGRVAGSSLVVAPDTGPLHVAHALGVPVIGLFGHTNPWRVGPWQRFRDLVVDRYTEPGAEPDPSGYLPREDRMDAITVEDVLEKVEAARSTYL